MCTITADLCLVDRHMMDIIKKLIYLHGLQVSPIKIGDRYLGSKIRLVWDNSIVCWGNVDTREVTDMSTYSRGFVNLYLARHGG